MPILTGEIVAVILFFIGLLGVVVRRNIMLTVLSVGIMNMAVVLFFVTMNSGPDYVPPMVGTQIAGTADPVPQALMITSVVIGVSVQAVLLVLVMNLFRQYGTLDWYEARRLRAAEINGHRHVPAEKQTVLATQPTFTDDSFT